jgi:hypothetical protein
MMHEKKGLVLDGVDLLLLAAIVGLAIVVFVLLLPMLPGLGLGLWNVCRAVLRCWRWPFWVWTIVGTVALVVLVWLRKQFE